MQRLEAKISSIPLEQGDICNLGFATQVHSCDNYLSKSRQGGKEVAIGEAPISLQV
jgi:hypothetical protein